MGVVDRLQSGTPEYLRARELNFGHVGQWHGSAEYSQRTQLVAIELDSGTGSDVIFVRVPVHAAGTVGDFHPLDEVSLVLPDLLGLFPDA